MSDKEFTCPKCGGHFYGRDVKMVDDGIRPMVKLTTVRCNTPKCGWRGEWPQKEESK